MNVDVLLVIIQRLTGTRISPNWMLNSLAMRHSPTASRRLNPVTGALTPVVPLVRACVDLPRFAFSVSTKKKTFGATCPAKLIRARRISIFCCHPPVSVFVAFATCCSSHCPCRRIPILKLTLSLTFITAWAIAIPGASARTRATATRARRFLQRFIEFLLRVLKAASSFCSVISGTRVKHGGTWRSGRVKRMQGPLRGPCTLFTEGGCRRLHEDLTQPPQRHLALRKDSAPLGKNLKEEDAMKTSNKACQNVNN